MPVGCGCCLDPVHDEKEECDLCSEATGKYDGIGWRISLCPLHAAAPALRAALDLCVRQLEAMDNTIPFLAEARAALAAARGEG